MLSLCSTHSPFVRKPTRPVKSLNFLRTCTTSSATSSNVSAKPLVPRKALGVDFGTVWTGLAVGTFSYNTPLQVLRNDPNQGAFARKIVDVAVEQGAAGIVVGIPVRQDGSLTDPATDSPIGAKCRDFAHNVSIVAQKQDIDVFLFNERLTTHTALWQQNIERVKYDNMDRKTRNAKQLDAWSAAMLLSEYYKKPHKSVRVRLKAFIE
eukprot:jgi/Chrzof1/4127/Cz14g00050.t1